MSAGDARGLEAAARALWCRVPAPGCSSDPDPRCGCPTELSAPRSRRKARSLLCSRPRPAESGSGDSAGPAALPTDPLPFYWGGKGGEESPYMDARKRASGEHPRSLEGRQQGSGRGVGGSEQERLMWGGGGGAGARDAPGERPTSPPRLAPEPQARSAKCGWCV